ncbi:MAG: peptidylprolyl isomerase [Bacteroidota bacterium]
MITKGKKVAVHYELHIDNAAGELIESTREHGPMSFTFKEDQMIEGFEKGLEGLKAGDTFEIAIPCAEAYGEEQDEYFMEFPKSEFIGDDGEWDDELFAVGEVIPMQTPEGYQVQGVVEEVKLNTIVIDFNHPLAGENLFFKGEVVSVSE